MLRHIETEVVECHLVWRFYLAARRLENSLIANSSTAVWLTPMLVANSLINFKASSLKAKLVDRFMVQIYHVNRYVVKPYSVLKSSSGGKHGNVASSADRTRTGGRGP